jgi:heme oxygenase
MSSAVSGMPQAASRATVNLPLSMQLREATASLHDEIERKLDFPGSISNLELYRLCLSRFYSLYGPIEALFARFSDWSGVGIVLREHNQSTRLAHDLAALRVPLDDLTDAPLRSLPNLPGFAHALGGLYVLEGSTLGAQYILPRLKLALGVQIIGADLFFSGNGPQSGTCWKQFRAALDRYGETHPDDTEFVIDGARSTFTAVGNWMQS